MDGIEAEATRGGRRKQSRAWSGVAAEIGSHHGLAAAMAQLVPHLQGGTEGSAGIAGGRLHIQLAEGGVGGHLAVGHRVGAAAAGNAELIGGMALVQGAQQVEEGFFIHRLGGAGDVLVALLERLIALAGRAKQLLKGGAVVGPTTGVLWLHWCARRWVAWVKKRRSSAKRPAGSRRRIWRMAASSLGWP